MQIIKNLYEITCINTCKELKVLLHNYINLLQGICWMKTSFVAKISNLESQWQHKSIFSFFRLLRWTLDTRVSQTIINYRVRSSVSLQYSTIQKRSYRCVLSPRFHHFYTWFLFFMFYYDSTRSPHSFFSYLRL